MRSDKYYQKGIVPVAIIPPALFLTIITTILVLVILRGGLRQNTNFNPDKKDKIVSDEATPSAGSITDVDVKNDNSIESQPEETLSSAAFLLEAKNKYQADEEFSVKVLARSKNDASNLFVAELNFSKDIFKVKGINTGDSFVRFWADNFFDNETGKINLVGGIPNPGFKTQGKGGLLAVIIFKPKKTGEGSISFDKNSAIFRNSDNKDILEEKSGIQITITE
ncbi:hypothetical protein HYW46_04985 [Candidatus Daviesbacteria bacterium]|nr:hypothetical protein [Candidatus Daviesbacteria bacterium]